MLIYTTKKKLQNNYSKQKKLIKRLLPIYIHINKFLEKSIVTESTSVTDCKLSREGEGQYGAGKFGNLTDMFIILIVVLVSSVQTYVKTIVKL